MTEPLPDEIDDALWAEACRRAVAIRRFLLSGSGQSTVAAIADLASELQVSQPSVLTPKSLRRILQITDSITANIFQMLGSLAIEAIESGTEHITDGAVEA